MPRKQRVWYPGASYHIINRGNRRSDLFREDEDYETYLHLLSIALRKFDQDLLGYCLMTNHVHLQMETKDVPIWHPIKYVHMTYTKYFNDKYHYVGHLFQGRYTSVCIESDAQLLLTSRYIHMNPVKAGMTEKPDTYRWSSCAAFYGLVDCPMVNKNKILRMFAPLDQIPQYCDFVEHPDFSALDGPSEDDMHG